MTPGPKALGRRLGATRHPARRVGGVLVMLLALGQSVIVAAPAAEATSLPSAAVVATYEARVIQQINVQRFRYGRHRLASGACPERYAEGWAPHLGSTWTFYHQSMYTILAGCKARVAAENLARGNLSADRFVAMWMASAGHRANILDGRLTLIGVAAVYARGQWVVVADFTRP